MLSPLPGLSLHGFHLHSSVNCHSSVPPHLTPPQILFSNKSTESISINSSVVRAPDSRLKDRRFESWREWPKNFLLQFQLCVLTLISVSVLPPVLPQEHIKILIILPKVQVAGYSQTHLRAMYVALHEVT